MTDLSEASVGRLEEAREWCQSKATILADRCDLMTEAEIYYALAAAALSREIERRGAEP